MATTGFKRGGGVGSGSGDSSGGGGQDRSLAFRHALSMVSPFDCRGMIEEVLDWRDEKKVSQSAADQLESAINDLGLGLPSYMNSYRAPKQLLIDPLAGVMTDNDRLLGAVLRVWVESRSELREVVGGCAESVGIPVEDPDFKGRCFRDYLPLVSWNRALAKISRESKGELDRREVSLMLCMVTGRLPGVLGRAESAGVGSLADFPFEGLLPELQGMLSGRGGLDAAARFRIEAVALMDARLEAGRRVSELANSAEGLCLRFMPELVYLGRELPAGLSFDLSLFPVEAISLSEASSLLERLGTALEGYRDAARTEDYASWDLERRGAEGKKSAADEALSLIEKLHGVFPERVEAVSEEGGEDAASDGGASGSEGGSGEWDALRLENEELRGENEVLRGENEVLRGENDRLRRELHFARAAEESLRGRVERGESGESGGSAAPVSDVREAVARAEREFGGKELLFYLNNASNVDTQFERAEEVFSVLRWLATDYRSGRMEGDAPDWDLSLRAACSGWSYASDNSDFAMNKYPDAYTAKGPNGRVYELGAHIRRGVRNEERYTMRIAFAWDDAEARVVVGYVGKHQPNDF